MRSDNISNHSSFPKQGSMTSLTPDELIIMMSGRQHESGEEEDEEQRKGRWKRNQEESGRSGSASDDLHTKAGEKDFSRLVRGGGLPSRGG